MSKYKNYVNWKLPEELRQAIRVKAAVQNKKQQTLAIEILSKELLENDDPASTGSAPG